MPDDVKQESFEEFRKSFAYGSRSDLNFKFMSHLSDEDAATFLQGLLWKLGDTLDDGQLQRIADQVYEWQVRAYDEGGEWTYADGPFAPLEKPLSECRIGLLSSSGHYVIGHDPEPLGVKNMTQKEAVERIVDFIRAEPNLNPIPAETPNDQLRARHGGYDVRSADADPNVVYPHDVLLDLEKEGVIGELARETYTFVGACSQRRLLKKSGPRWVKMFQELEVDAVVLVPV